MNDRAQFNEALDSAESYATWEREQNEPRVKEALMTLLDMAGTPQESCRGYPFPKNAQPIDHFAEWLTEQRYFVRDILNPGERTREEMLHGYRMAWIDEIVFNDGWENIVKRYELDV